MVEVLQRGKGIGCGAGNKIKGRDCVGIGRAMWYLAPWPVLS